MHQQGSRKARRQAKRVATEAFAKANLSIQELMDCDVAADQGCTGGNPLLAFYYIHRYGLVSWEDYPYRGHAGQCRLGQIQNPVATVSSWGILPKNYEDRIELALRYIGPVAVAINGAHPAFINYQGGILNIPHCDQKANHALLIVGYGQQQTTKYWIARNSWGKDWGEEGYVRIQRGDGMKHTPGMCGIAKSPSIALGAKLNWDRRPLVKDRQEDPTSWRHHSREYGSRNGGSNNMEADCLQREDDYSLADLLGCHFDRFWYQHRAISLGMISVLGALLMTVMPLTFARRLRRKQRRRPLSNATLSSASMTGSSSPSSFGSLVGGGCGNSIKDNERQHLHRGGRHIIINCRGDKEERQNLQQQQQVGESTPLFSNAEQNYGSKETCFAAQTVKR